VTPDAAGIGDALGDSFAAWQQLDAALAEPALGLELSWRYYRDGGWLRKALRGKKTVAWLAVWEGYATITFYFAARHRPGLVALPLPAPLRRQAAEAEMSGALLPLVVEIRTAADVDAALEVLRFKLASR
jgi:hypothetical protein